MLSTWLVNIVFYAFYLNCLINMSAQHHLRHSLDYIILWKLLHFGNVSPEGRRSKVEKMCLDSVLILFKCLLKNISVYVCFLFEIASHALKLDGVGRPR